MAARSEAAAGLQFLSEAFLNGIELIQPALGFVSREGFTEEIDAGTAAARMADWYGDYSPATDRKVRPSG